MTATYVPHRVFCDICNKELIGRCHGAVLLITHHTWRHANGR